MRKITVNPLWWLIVRKTKYPGCEALKLMLDKMENDIRMQPFIDKRLGQPWTGDIIVNNHLNK